MMARAQWLAREGYAVLAFDFQAHGESPGPFITFGRRESLDASAAVHWLRTRLPGERIGAIGASLGGAAALLGPSPLDVEALVLEAVYSDIETAVSNRLALHLGGAARALAPLLIGSARLIIGEDPAALRPAETIARVRAPVLVAGGAEDRHTTPAEIRAMAGAAGATGSRLWLVPGTAHVDLHAAATDDYMTIVGGFLRRHVRGE